eukprot:CAMPEP_0202456980 /NCGR_PEP_ID=MMETSP1360-20130828/14109_1 /ASSEMBLY_ACC=CAM_ASM_000848 /TAXON_ID=515479 /ORGANISM="Licmophora paradoxa, Strain CCMP2313" /LENGTH=329 /DNA_ID=CAMNT_0049076943 /DNA_START=89 /DNA_END=1078 /DNA_ORIENTATION=+
MNYDTRSSMVNEITQDYYMPSNDGTVTLRIRNPQPHDVLCGRGGGINSHSGNKTFREFVRERKNSYNLASSKSDKARVAKEVMNRVHSLNPPGRFLQRDGSGAGGGWWVEIDEVKALAKTSQALREGAPSIRAQHKHDLEHTQNSGSIKRNINQITEGTRNRDTPITTTTTSITTTASSPLLIQTDNVTSSSFQDYNYPRKQMRTTQVPIDESTPPLISAPAVEYPARFSLDQQPNNSEWKLNTQELRIDEFVNPFENEEETFQRLYGIDEEDRAIVSSKSAGQQALFPACPMCGLPIEHGRGCLCCSVQSENYSEVHVNTTGPTAVPV